MDVGLPNNVEFSGFLLLGYDYKENKWQDIQKQNVNFVELKD